MRGNLILSGWIARMAMKVAACYAVEEESNMAIQVIYICSISINAYPILTGMNRLEYV